MDLLKLQKANEIKKQIEKLNENIKDASYTQNESISGRQMYITWNGCQNPILAPSELWRTIGKLIITVNQSELMKLEKEFEAL